VVEVRYSVGIDDVGRIAVITGVQRSHGIAWLLGTVISIAIATLLILTVRGTHRSGMVPVVFLVVIMLCARYFGVVAGILGSLITTMLFAIFLFSPYGSLRVHDPQALWDLGLLLFAGIALSYANAAPKEKTSPAQGLKSR
jgi:K+-sensing histidine kinase KdpD